MLFMSQRPDNKGTSSECTQHQTVDQRGHQLAGSGTGLTSQISSAYCLMVRSDEKKPLPAVYRMLRRVHSSWSRYSLSTSACAPGVRDLGEGGWGIGLGFLPAHTAVKEVV